MAPVCVLVCLSSIPPGPSLRGAVWQWDRSVCGRECSESDREDLTGDQPAAAYAGQEHQSGGQLRGSDGNVTTK